MAKVIVSFGSLVDLTASLSVILAAWNINSSEKIININQWVM